MTALEYLDRVDRELIELESMCSPSNWHRFTSRRSDLRNRVATLRRMTGGLRQLMEREQRS